MAKQKRGAAGIRCLPEGIIHRILSFLTDDDKRKARYLSAEWSDAYRTYSELRFKYMEFLEFIKQKYKTDQTGSMLLPLSNDEIRSMFRKEIDNTLVRRTLGGSSSLPYKLYLDGRYCDGDGDAARLDKWLKIAIQNGVKELELTCPSGYILPDCILEAKSLTMLVLRDCKLQNVQILRQNIHTLDLERVSIDDSSFSSLIRSCPLIQNLRLAQSAALNRVKLRNVPCLRKLDISYPVTDSLRVEIDAPNLQTAQLRGLAHLHFAESRSYRNLQELKLELVYTGVSRAFFGSFRFPNLKSLVVWDCLDFPESDYLPRYIHRHTNLNFKPVRNRFPFVRPEFRGDGGRYRSYI